MNNLINENSSNLYTYTISQLEFLRKLKNLKSKISGKGMQSKITDIDNE